MASLFFSLDRAGLATAQFMLGALWQSSIVFIALGALLWALRGHRAGVRQALWVGFVLATPLLPVLTYALGWMDAPRVGVPVLPRHVRPSCYLGFRDESAAQEPDLPDLPAEVETQLPPAPAPPPHGFGPVYPPLHSSPWTRLLAAYALGCLLFSGWLLIGELVVHHWARKGTPCDDGGLHSAFQMAAKELGTAHRAPVIVSDRLRFPCRVGLLRPRVLIPRRLLDSLGERDLAATALHLVCQVVRHDRITLGLVRLVRAVLFPHPLVHLACYRVSLLAEQACDEAALDSTQDPAACAEMLLRYGDEAASQSLWSRVVLGSRSTRAACHRRADIARSWRSDQIRSLNRRELVGVVCAAVTAVAFAASVPLVERAAPARSSAGPPLFTVALRIRRQSGQTVTRELLVGHDQTRAVHLGTTERVRIKGLGWQTVRDTPTGMFVFVRCSKDTAGRLSGHARCYTREVRDAFPDGSARIDTDDGPRLGARMRVGKTARVGSKDDSTELHLRLKALRHGSPPKLTESESALVQEEARLGLETAISDGLRNVQGVLGSEWVLVGKAASHERSLWWINRPIAQREEKYQPGLEGCTFSFEHRRAKIPKHRLEPGMAAGPAFLRLWYRPRLAFVLPSPWLEGEHRPFPITVGAYKRGVSAGICDHEVIFAAIAAPNAQETLGRLRGELAISLHNVPRTALTTLTPRSTSDPTVFVLDGRPRPAKDHLSPSFYVRRALAPLSAHTETRLWDDFAPHLAGVLSEARGKSVLIMVGIEALADRCVATIKDYVARGNGLLVLGDADASLWLENAMVKPGLLPGPFTGGHSRKRKKLALNCHHPCHRALAKIGISALGVATFPWSISGRADAWPVGAEEGPSDWNWAFDSTYGFGRTMAVGLTLDRSRSDVPERVAFMPWLTEVVRYLASPAEIEWGPERGGLALRLATMRPDYPPGARVRVAAILRNVGNEPLAVVGAGWRSELDPWTVNVNGKETPSPCDLFGGPIVLGKASLEELAPGESLALPVPERYFRGSQEQRSRLAWGLPPGRHRVEAAYTLRPEQVRGLQWTGARIWTGELRSNALTLVIGSGR